MNSDLIDLRGIPVELHRAGSGTPLLYLHGAAGDSQWLPVFDRWAEHFTVYHPMHPGFGQSSGLERIDGIDDLAVHYMDLLIALGLEGKLVHVVGSSFGGWIAAELAQRTRRQVDRLVLIDAAGLWLDEAPVAEMFGEPPPELAKRMFHDQQHPIAMAMSALTDPSQLPEEVLLPMFKAMEALAKIAWNPYFHNPKLEGRLDRVTAQTLVIWGKQDGLIPLAHGQRYASRIHGARLEVLDNCGHFPILEQPERVCALVNDFLRTPPAAGGVTGS
jgi:pimeloyl-ACP methyl ester carboxylesterase